MCTRSLQPIIALMIWAANVVPWHKIIWRNCDSILGYIFHIVHDVFEENLWQALWHALWTFFCLRASWYSDDVTAWAHVTSIILYDVNAQPYYSQYCDLHDMIWTSMRALQL